MREGEQRKVRREGESGGQAQTQSAPAHRFLSVASGLDCFKTVSIVLQRSVMSVTSIDNVGLQE
jgi:hypothetical protein